MAGLESDPSAALRDDNKVALWDDNKWKWMMKQRMRRRFRPSDRRRRGRGERWRRRLRGDDWGRRDWLWWADGRGRDWWSGRRCRAGCARRAWD